MVTEPRIVYFSSVTENTKYLVEKLSYRSVRIPLRRGDDFLKVNYPFILFVPSYGGGSETGAIPKQVLQFLNDEQNRSYCLGTVNGGNINFGKDYGIAGRLISRKLGVPNFYNFELRGLPGDLERIEEGVGEVFARYDAGDLQLAAV